MAGWLKSKLTWAVAIPVALVGLYALLGFKLAPGIVRDQAQAFVREHYQRELAVGAIRIQPFTLQAEVRDLALPDADGRPLLGCARLFVDFELASLWTRTFTFRTIAIDAPRVRAVRRADGSLNLAELALPDEEPERPRPRVWVQHLGVERGSIEFSDEARATPLVRRFEAVAFALEDFRTTPEGGDFSFSARSRQAETFEWQGRFTLEPAIASQGEFKVGALQAPGLMDMLGDARPFDVTRGTVDLRGTYRASLGDDLEVRVDLPTIELADLGVRARGADRDWVQVPSLVVSGTTLDLPARSLTVEKVLVAGLGAQVWRSADGTLNLGQLLATGPAAAPRSSGESWTVNVGGVELAAASIAFEDRTVTPASRFDLAPVNARISDVSLDRSRPLPVQLDAVINGQARFEASGTVAPQPLAADLDVRLARAPMQLLQPYLLPVADLTITAGDLDLQGKATLAPADDGRRSLGFSGSIAIDRFRSVDNALRQDLVSFRRLEMSKLSFATTPNSLGIDRVLVRQPYARLIISREQVINIAAVFDPQGTAAALAGRRAEAAAAAARTPAERRRLEREHAAAERAAAKARRSGKSAAPQTVPAADVFPVRIREIRVEGGRMNFSDQFVQPNFSADVQQLSGTITGASSARNSRARVALTGRLDQFSPVSIQGELQPFAFDRYTDLGLRFENIPLPILNPYSTPLAGYAIAKGKLTTDLHYTIVDRKLDARHAIRIDQLEWGEATATQGEATLPVKFATALLRDRDGVIKLDVPVGGTLDDPTFRIGPIVWQIIRNIIVKAVTAPFALLGSLFSGAEEAQYVDFAPGDAALDAATTERLGVLARSLVEKPGLKIDVPIGVLDEIDRPALEDRAYLAAIDEAAAAQLAKKAGDGAPPPTYAMLPAERKIGLLTALLQRRTGTAPQVPEAPEPPEGISRAEARALRQAAAVEFLERALRAGVSVPEADVARLAEERAAAIERALLVGGELDPTRVFKVRNGKVSRDDGKVRFQLGLE